MKYKTVIFDFDGTLADTSPGIFGSIRFTQKMMGLPEITLEQMYSHVGPPMEESYNRNFGLTGDELNKAVQYHKQYAAEQGYKEVSFYSGIFQLLDKLKASGIQTAVATLKAHDTVLKILDSFDIRDKFSFVIGTFSDKPMTKSQLIDFCINKTGSKINDCVLVGDSCYDALGAQESRVDFIGVTYGFGFKTSKDINKFVNKGVACSVDELTDLLL